MANINTDPALIRRGMELIEESIQLHLKMIDTQRQLKKSLALALIDPSVWEPGTKVRTRIEGLVPSSIMGDLPTKESRFVVIKSDGTEVKVPFNKDLPEELWPEGLLEKMHKSKLGRQRLRLLGIHSPEPTNRSE